MGDRTDGPDPFAGLPDSVYVPKQGLDFSEDRCFLCGRELTPDTGAQEWVFPEWVQSEFGLAGMELGMIFHPPTTYGALTLPCCRTCHDQALGPIDREVHEAYSKGHEAMKEVGADRLYLWLAKIFYGLLFREVFLPLDPSAPLPPLDPDVAEYSAKLHLLLQAARGVVVWERSPYSIAVFSCQESREKERNFDFGNDLPGMTVGIRLGSTAYYAWLFDFGAMRESLRLAKFEEAARVDLHPLQFREVMANGTYAAHLYGSVGYCSLSVRDGRVAVIGEPFVIEGSPEDFDPATFASVLAQVTGAELDDIYRDGLLMTWLTDTDGQPYFIPIDGKIRGYDRELLKRGAKLAYRVVETVPFCWMCTARTGERAKEHVFALDLLKKLGAEDEQFSPTHYSPLGFVISSRPTIPATSLLAGEVCKSCNGGWMSELEVSAQPILLAGRQGASPRRLNRDGQFVLARWFFKTAVVLNTSQNWRLLLPRDVRHAAKTGLHADVRVFVARRTAKAEDQLAFRQGFSGIIATVPKDKVQKLAKVSQRIYAGWIGVLDWWGVVMYAPPGGWVQPGGDFAQIWPYVGDLDWEQIPDCPDLDAVFMAIGDPPSAALD